LFAVVAAGLLVCAAVLFGLLLQGPSGFTASLAFVGTLPETPLLAVAFGATPIIAATFAILLWRFPDHTSRPILFGSLIVLALLCFLRAYVIAIIFGAPVLLLALALRRRGA
jgi:hypothetical protein